MARMEWKKLLSTKRLKDITNKYEESKKSNSDDIRCIFEKDFDQIIFSHPFRRLQDKTQVIPFPEFDFVHTRLTHSIEVASIGRSLGKMAAKLIDEKENNIISNDLKFCYSDIGALVASACLAHDIGNPPFGHSGEDTIRNYFQINKHIKPNYEELKEEGNKFVFYNVDKDARNINELETLIPNDSISKYDYYQNLKKWRDLIKYEGNANGFRILVNSESKGIIPSCALLGTYTKYPKESFINNEEDLFKVKQKSFSKYGFFQSDKENFKIMAEELGLIKFKGLDENDIAYHRHPLTFLVEAADDIAYRIIDIEDALRLELIDFEKIYSTIELRKRDIEYDNDNIVELFEDFEINNCPKNLLIEIAKLDNNFNHEFINDCKDQKSLISYLRSKSISVLISLAFEQFEKKYDDIMEGKFNGNLLDSIDDDSVKSNLKSLRKLLDKYVYNYKHVLESEASGFSVIGFLLATFLSSCNVCFSCGGKETIAEKKYKSLLPKEYLSKFEKTIGDLSFDDKYDRIMLILDYITGMTDNYATHLYRKINGFELNRR